MTQPTPGMEQLGSHGLDFKHKELWVWLCQTCTWYISVFYVMKGFEYLLVYSCLHYPLFENEEVLYIFFFKAQCFPYFHDKRRLQVPCWTEIHDESIINPFSGHSQAVYKL